MKINVVTIAKPEQDSYSRICDHFVKMSGRYAKVAVHDLFNAKVTRAQEQGKAQARKLYADLFDPWLRRGLTVALDPEGKEPDSETFAAMLEGHAEVTFFIGGAFGHAPEFLKRCDRSLSLSKLTMSHKIAKTVLLEQIYRGLTILHNHPYHK
ncbi:23S rRNA (pseudouridine(1915)-N(3))-methyltransferase RlmH [Hydrogenimonas sp. SS33]|uniref:23S rRNA (pseudouridine(1915)-N(3))-methyltransferase RlmH n=1 Tax=Hydrogenimonas leucolamina TaxID=2954236 RepID=UPI00336BF9A5